MSIETLRGQCKNDNNYIGVGTGEGGGGGGGGALGPVPHNIWVTDANIVYPPNNGHIQSTAFCPL